MAHKCIEFTVSMYINCFRSYSKYSVTEQIALFYFYFYFFILFNFYCNLNCCILTLLKFSEKCKSFVFAVRSTSNKEKFFP